MTEVILPDPVAREIESQGAAAYPNECCGILIGREISPGRRVVDRLVAMKNVFDPAEQYHRFTIDPLAQIKAEKEADAEGRQVIGYYHSHPDHPAKPSEYDRQHMPPFSFYSQVILAIEKGRATEMTAWSLNESTEQFESQKIVRPMSTYAHPEMLVSTDWVAGHWNDPRVKIVEVDADTKAYDSGHLPGVIGWNWQTDLQDRIVRDVVDPRTFAELCRGSGIANDDTVILYGDNNNWFAAWALWQFKYHGHRDVRLMNGGRKKWELEKREMTTEIPKIEWSKYAVPGSDESIRAYRDEIMKTLRQGTVNLVDVRSPDEFTGKIIAPPGMTETAQRAGHIPGAKNIPWSKAVNEDGTFKSPDELRAIYADAGVDFGKPTIAYCRIGERSSHTWFVLRYLLGVNDVKNYDGSWTEWGNLVGAPIETGSGDAFKPEVKCP